MESNSKPGSKPPTETVRVRKSTARRLARLAGHADKSVPDYLSDLLGPILDAEEDKMLSELARERRATAGGETPARPKRR